MQGARYVEEVPINRYLKIIITHFAAGSQRQRLFDCGWCTHYGSKAVATHHGEIRETDGNTKFRTQTISFVAFFLAN